jgi:hypothetical protein
MKFDFVKLNPAVPSAQDPVSTPDDFPDLIAKNKEHKESENPAFYRRLYLQEAKTELVLIKKVVEKANEQGEKVKQVVDVDQRAETLDEMVKRGNRALSAVNLARKIQVFGEMPPQELDKNFKELLGQRDEKGNLLNWGTFDSFLESRGMAKVVTELKTGDQIVSFLCSSEKDVSIKHLNKTLGASATDSFIIYRKDLLRAAFCSNKANPDNGYLEELDQDYKQGIFKLRAGKNLDEFRQVLQTKLDEINEKLTKFLVDKGLQLGNGQYSLTSGIYENKIEDDNLDEGAKNFLAVQNSIQGAHLSRETHENSAIYQENAFENKLKSIAEIKNFLMGKTIRDVNGQTYNIFVDGLLNRDLVRLIRKEVFSVDETNPALVQTNDQLLAYLKSINFIDFARPYTTEELSANDPKMLEIAKRKALASKINGFYSGENSEFSQEDLKVLENSMLVENKDNDFESEAVFHEKAISFEPCTYLSFDVLDVGIDQLADYEKLINKWNDGQRENLKAEVLSGGDKITRSLRDFRAEIKNTLNQAGFGESAAYLVGGDEFTIALPTKDLPPDLLLNMKKVCEKYNGVRLVKSLRQSGPDKDQNQRHLDHQATLQRAEDGIDGAKSLEKEIQVFRQGYLEQLKKQYGDAYNAQEAVITKVLDRLFSESGVNDYYVEQLPNRGFDVVIWDNLPPGELLGKNARSALDRWKEYLTTYLNVRFPEEMKKLSI